MINKSTLQDALDCFERYEIYAELYDADDTISSKPSTPTCTFKSPSKKSFGELTNTSHINNKNHDEEESTS